MGNMIRRTIACFDEWESSYMIPQSVTMHWTSRGRAQLCKQMSAWVKPGTMRLPMGEASPFWQGRPYAGVSGRRETNQRAVYLQSATYVYPFPTRKRYADSPGLGGAVNQTPTNSLHAAMARTVLKQAHQQLYRRRSAVTPRTCSLVQLLGSCTCLVRLDRLLQSRAHDESRHSCLQAD